MVIALSIEHHILELEAQVQLEPGESESPEGGAKELADSTKDEKVEPPRALGRESNQTEALDARRVRTESERLWAPRISAEVGYSFGVLPVGAPLWSVGAGFIFPRQWSLDLAFVTSESMRISFPVDEADTISRVAIREAFTQAIGQLMGGRLLGCYEGHFDKGDVSLCTGVGAGRFHARGVEGFEPNPGQSVPWLSGILRAVGRVPARGPFGMSLSADFFANFLRPGVELSGEGSAKSPRDAPPVGGAVSLGTFFVIE